MDLSSMFTRVNAPLSWLLRSPLHALVDSALMLVTVTGRRSGKRITLPVGYQRDGNRIFVLVSKARRKQWWRNLLTPSPVELHLGGKDVGGTGRVLEPGSEEFFAAIERTLTRMPWLGKQFDVPTYRRDRGLTPEERASVASEMAAIEILLD